MCNFSDEAFDSFTVSIYCAFVVVIFQNACLRPLKYHFSFHWSKKACSQGFRSHMLKKLFVVFVSLSVNTCFRLTVDYFLIKV